MSCHVEFKISISAVPISVGTSWIVHHQEMDTWPFRSNPGHAMLHHPGINPSTFIKYLNQFEILSVGYPGLQASTCKCSKLVLPGQGVKHLTAPEQRCSGKQWAHPLPHMHRWREERREMGEGPSSHYNILQMLLNRTAASSKRNSLAVDL